MISENKSEYSDNQLTGCFKKLSIDMRTNLISTMMTGKNFNIIIGILLHNYLF